MNLEWVDVPYLIAGFVLAHLILGGIAMLRQKLRNRRRNRRPRFDAISRFPEERPTTHPVLHQGLGPGPLASEHSLRCIATYDGKNCTCRPTTPANITAPAVARPPAGMPATGPSRWNAEPRTKIPSTLERKRRYL